MTWWFKLKSASKLIWVFVAAVVAALIAWLLYRRKEAAYDNAMWSIEDKLGRRAAIAHAQAAVEITAARTKDEYLRQDLRAILDIPDEAERLKYLTRLMEQVRAGDGT